MTPFKQDQEHKQRLHDWLKFQKGIKPPFYCCLIKTEKMLHFLAGHKLNIITSFPNLTYNQQWHSISIQQALFSKIFSLCSKSSSSALLGKKWKHFLWWHTSIQGNNRMIYLIFLLSHCDHLHFYILISLFTLCTY